jgi:hypothetical protein
LHNVAVGPGRGKGAHVLEVARGKPLHVGKLPAQIGRESVNHFGSPAFLRLPLENGTADVPIEQHHGCVGGEHHAHALFPNALLEFGEQGCVICGEIAGNSCVKSARFGLFGHARVLLRLSGFIRHTPTPSGWRQWPHRASPLRLAVRAIVQRAAASFLERLIIIFLSFRPDIATGREHVTVRANLIQRSAFAEARHIGVLATFFSPRHA